MTARAKRVVWTVPGAAADSHGSTTTQVCVFAPRFGLDRWARALWAMYTVPNRRENCGMRDTNELGDAEMRTSDHRTVPPASRRRVRTRVRHIVPWAAIACLIMVTSSLSGSAVAATLNASAPTQAGPICAFALSIPEISLSVSGLSISLTPEKRSLIEGQIGNLYSSVCADPQVTKLVQDWGVANTSLGLYGHETGEVLFANFSVNWAHWVGSTEYFVEQAWSMDLGSSQVAGPFSWTSQKQSNFSSAGVHEAQDTATTWGGYEFRAGSYPPEAYVAQADAQVVPMASETNQETDTAPGDLADSAAAVWVGLEDSYGGSSNLIQTGYAYDATNPSNSWCVGFAGSCNHGLWWAIIFSDGTGTQGFYPGMPTVSQSDTLFESVHVLGVTEYQTNIEDVNHGTWWSNMVIVSPSHSFSPVAGVFVVEAPVMEYEPCLGFPGQLCPYFTQIAGFAQQPVSFTNGEMCTDMTCVHTVSLQTAYNNGWDQVDTVNEAAGSDTVESMSGGSPTIAWSNSGFDYCLMNGGVQIHCRGGGGCVAYGTPILTPSGYVPVQKLKAGDAVEEYNFSSQNLAQGTFVSGNTTSVTQLIDINNGWLYVTPTDQPFYIRNSTFMGWLNNPRDLTTSDYVFDPVTQVWVHVTSIVPVQHRTVAFDVVTSSENNFIANGALLDRKLP